MKTLINTTITSLSLAAVMLTSCDPTSPDLTDEEYLQTDNPMDSWVAGINAELASAVGEFALLLDVATDNYRNVYSRYNREFDKPNILYTDSDVETLQRYIGKLRESALYALNTIAPIDAPTASQQQDIYVALAYSYILAGENFTAIPMEENGLPVQPSAQLAKAIEVLNEADAVLSSTDFQPIYHTLLARVYRDLGDVDNASQHARQALASDDDFVYYVEYDEANSIVNYMKDASYSTNWWEPLPRLDYLDPKYQSTAESQRMAIAKAEEDYLILAEASLYDTGGSEYFMQNYSDALFALLASRGNATLTDDGEMREYTSGDVTINLNTSGWLVRASAGEEAREGLILNRAGGDITVPSLSATSVTQTEFESATGDELLQAIYLMRQEIFFAEGRRFADLGMRLPLCEVEANRITYNNSGYDVADYIVAYIPSYLPTDEHAMDAYTVDADTKVVTITYNLNKLLVQNKALDCIVPFE